MATGGYAEAVLVALALVALLLAPPAVAAPLRDVPVRVVQPGGEVLDLLASGDEFRRVAHDAAGFTVVRDPVTSLVVYADLAGGRLVPTGLVVGAADPRDAGLSPGLAPATNEVLRAAWQGALAFPGSPPAPAGVRGAPRVGTLNNLVVFIRFADEPAFSTPFSYYRTLFDDPDPSRPSLYGYFAEASYGRLAVRSTFYPAPVGDAIASYQAEHPRAYYQPRHPDTNPDGYEDGLDAVMREHELLAAALESVAGQIPPGLDVDGDDDGMVDNLVFILSGGPDAWADLLWPHMALLTKMVVVNGATALLYNLQLDEFVRSGKQLGVLAHELFHTLGAPDMYHYSHDGLRPLGPWDLMESDQPVPQHMCAHVKRLYGGWIDAIPEITTNGRYTLAPLAEAPGAAYRFAAQGSKTEYFVVEYRRATGVYESSLPGSGLVVFRVDGARELYGNRDGPPDEIYALRPGGSPITDGDVKQAFMSWEAGRTRLAEETDPHPFLADGTPSLVRIFDISAARDTISFSVCLSAPECAGRECGDDGCGGSCGPCPEGTACDDGLCGGTRTCQEWMACRDGCADDACREACADGLSGGARRLAATFTACVVNLCASLDRLGLAACLASCCAGPRDACVSGGQPAEGDGSPCAAECATSCGPLACGDVGCGLECPGCPPDDDPCTVEWCASGACSTEAVPDGWPCTDGSKCTVGDRCVAGTCVAHKTVECRPLDACHVAGECDPATGECSNPPAPDAGDCADAPPEPPADASPDAPDVPEPAPDVSPVADTPVEAVAEAAPCPVARSGSGCSAGAAPAAPWAAFALLLLIPRRRRAALPAIVAAAAGGPQPLEARSAR